MNNRRITVVAKVGGFIIGPVHSCLVKSNTWTLEALIKAEQCFEKFQKSHNCVTLINKEISVPLQRKSLLTTPLLLQMEQSAVRAKKVNGRGYICHYNNGTLIKLQRINPLGLFLSLKYRYKQLCTINQLNDSFLK